IRNPLEIILPFEFKENIRFVGISGLSYHGGLIGLVVGTLIFCYKNRVDFWKLADLVSFGVPLGYTFGRIGNFLNRELYGRPTSFFLGMYFPSDPLNKLRHPSQLYEAFFEGIFLFLILLAIHKRIKKIKGLVFCFYLLGYGILRFVIEYFRQPDPQLGFVVDSLTMGQILCLFMVITGICLGVLRYIRK
ncbi:MAG: prolipoprotein diacylglyceryl transferase, partial [Candidatus Omnitrophica bacterium]|nr:prolipoprotein diacylglyceryl transferase [Candidatus Omnitrophota bacterium]